MIAEITTSDCRIWSMDCERFYYSNSWIKLKNFSPKFSMFCVLGIDFQHYCYCHADSFALFAGYLTFLPQRVPQICNSFKTKPQRETEIIFSIIKGMTLTHSAATTTKHSIFNNRGKREEEKGSGREEEWWRSWKKKWSLLKNLWPQCIFPLPWFDAWFQIETGRCFTASETKEERFCDECKYVTMIFASNLDVSTVLYC